MTCQSRTTKEQRARWQEFCGDEHEDGRNEGTWEYADIIALIDDADAADALRAQVATLQAENERLQDAVKLGAEILSGCVLKEDMEQARDNAYANYCARCRAEQDLLTVRAELAAAQAKLAVPVLKDVQDMAESLWLLDIDDAAYWLESLARENAALRTKAEALERERDGMRETLQLIVDLAYDRWQQPDGKLMTHVDNAGQRCWIIAAGVLDEARAALAEKP